MSLFSIIAVIFLIYLIFNSLYCCHKKREYNPKIPFICLSILLIFQVVFIFLDGFSFYYLFIPQYYAVLSFIISICVIVSTVVIVKRIISKSVVKKNIISLLFLVFITLIYTEYFNGYYSFDNLKEFQSYNIPLKKYYNVVPYKLRKVNDGFDGIQAEVYILPEILNPFFRPKGIKKENGKFFYYIFRWGENGKWFEFGIPMGE